MRGEEINEKCKNFSRIKKCEVIKLVKLLNVKKLKMPTEVTEQWLKIGQVQGNCRISKHWDQRDAVDLQRETAKNPHIKA